MKFTSRIDKKYLAITKEEFIFNICKDKEKILHLGCVDSGLLEERIQQNQLLHLRLIEMFGQNRVFGLDQDEAGIEILRKKGIDNLFIANAENMNFQDKFDVIVAGDIIEHVNNVGNFLKSIYRALNNNGILIISTPNAHYYLFFIAYFWGIESIHPDHNYLFSATSLAMILKKHDFKILEYYFWGTPENFFKSSDKIALKLVKLMSQLLANLIFYISKCMFPQYLPSIIMCAKK